jgi:hypothetical protein
LAAPLILAAGFASSSLSLSLSDESESALAAALGAALVVVVFFTTFSSSLLSELSSDSSLALDSESDSDSGSGVGALDFLDFLSLTADLAMSLLFALGVWAGLVTRPALTLEISGFFSFLEDLSWILVLPMMTVEN